MIQKRACSTKVNQHFYDIVKTRAIAPKKSMTLCYYHIKYEFQSESAVYSLPKCQGTSCSKQALYLKFK